MTMVNPRISCYRDFPTPNALLLLGFGGIIAYPH